MSAVKPLLYLYDSVRANISPEIQGLIRIEYRFRS